MLQKVERAVMDEVTSNALSIIMGLLTGVIISVIGVFASRKKVLAEIDVLASGEWRSLYAERKEREKLLKVELKCLQEQLDAVENQLDAVVKHRDLLLKQQSSITKRIENNGG